MRKKKTKTRAKQRKLAHRCDVIEREDLYRAQKGLCFYCGRKMKLRGKQNDGFRCTTEHIDPKHHSKDNSRGNKAASCQRCNYLKGSTFHEDFLAEWDGRWDEMPEFPFSKPEEE